MMPRSATIASCDMELVGTITVGAVTDTSSFIRGFDDCSDSASSCALAAAFSYEIYSSGSISALF